ncbi:MAG: TRAP transporter large permease [Spirochaetales bacterium]
MWLIILLFLIFLLINMPIAFTIGISASIFFLQQSTIPFSLAVQRMVTGTQSFPLLAVPFFILAGHIMNASGITQRLLKFADAIAGHIRGSIAQASIVLSVLMGGISGSSNADAAMETRLLMPTMRQRGYSDGFSTCVLAFGSLIVPIIPPSIGLILYGFVGQVSIGRLFIAGVIPGILMGGALMVTTYLIAKHRNYDPVLPPAKSFKEILFDIKESFWALIFPILLVFTIRMGIFTPSEAGAFAVVYAMFVGFFIHKELTFKKLKQALQDTVEDNAIIMLIVSMAAILGYVLAYGRVPQSIAQFILGLSTTPWIVMGLIIIFLFLVGTVMEGTVNILLLTPILLPLVQRIGYDPVHFGIIMAILIQLGGVTPPVGVNMYTVCSLSGVPISEFLKNSWPFLIAILSVVILVVLYPPICMFLPNILMPQ